MSKHTLGPWSLIKNSSWSEYHQKSFGAKEGYVICFGNEKQALASIIAMPFSTSKEIESNAKLISIAPEMYQLIKRINDLGCNNNGIEFFNEYHKIINESAQILLKINQ